MVDFVQKSRDTTSRGQEILFAVELFCYVGYAFEFEVDVLKILEVSFASLALVERSAF